jgi:hypothetical protein
MPRSKTVKKAAQATRSRTTTKDDASETDVLKVIKWARKHGALQIKVNGIEILFPPPDLETAATKSIASPAAQDWRKDYLGEASTENAPPAIRSIQDDPDLYARDSDVWANQTRLPRR